jgi:hypothetical protein
VLERAWARALRRRRDAPPADTERIDDAGPCRCVDTRPTARRMRDPDHVRRQQSAYWGDGRDRGLRPAEGRAARGRGEARRDAGAIRATGRKRARPARGTKSRRRRGRRAGLSRSRCSAGRSRPAPRWCPS